MVLVTTGIGASTWEGNCTTCLREPACASSPQEPLPLCPRTAASLSLRPTLRPAPRHPSATSSNFFGHDREAPLAPSPSGRGRGVRDPTACGQKPLTLTLSLRETGQETMAHKVIGNRTSAPWPPYGGTPYSGNSRARDGHGETATGRVSRSTRRPRTHHTVAPGLRESRPTL